MRADAQRALWRVDELVGGACRCFRRFRDVVAVSAAIRGELQCVVKHHSEW